MATNELNKPIEQLSLDLIKKVKAITFDLDGVIIPAGTFLRQSVDGTEFIMRTHKLSKEMIEMIKELKKHFWINFSSGRSLLYLEYILEEILWDKVSLTAENGNFILMDGKIEQLSLYEQRYFQKLTDIRADLRKLKEEKPNEINGFEPKNFIITLHTANNIPEVKEIVKKHDKENNLYCIWTSEGYDIGHIKTNKKTALLYLIEKLKINPEEMITTGNNLNDKEILEIGLSVTVDPELVSGKYAIPKKEGQLGGEVLARYILDLLGK